MLIIIQLCTFLRKGCAYVANVNTAHVCYNEAFCVSLSITLLLILENKNQSGPLFYFYKSFSKIKEKQQKKIFLYSFFAFGINPMNQRCCHDTYSSDKGSVISMYHLFI